MIARGGDDLGDRPAAVERHQHVPQRVARGVERDRQRELRPERGQAADAGHDPDVDTVMCRAPSPNRRGSFSASTAASTRSRLSNGSPMPMNTMLVRCCPSPPGAARPDAPGRRSRRPRGRARTRARPWRRTGIRPRTRPGSRGTACAVRAIRGAPGSASAPTRSARRHRADGAPSRSGPHRRGGSRCRRRCRDGTRARAPRAAPAAAS